MLDGKRWWQTIASIGGGKGSRGTPEDGGTGPRLCNVLLGGSNGQVNVLILGSCVLEGHAPAMPGQHMEEVQWLQLGQALHLDIN